MGNYASKTIVIIPAYEPPHAFVLYVKELLENGVGGIVVVNDGSGTAYDGIYEEISRLDGCTVLDYGKNRGKGYALKYAFEYCKNNYDDSYVFVTADCDGQHLAADVINCAQKAANHEGKLVLGSRNFALEQVPERSRTGNIFTRRMFKLLYGIFLSDTQTGLRAFSYSLLDELLKIKGDRFEYEMNMLIVLYKRHIDILEVPIETVYNEKPDDVEKVSHFRTVKDSVRVIGTLFSNLGWYFVSSVASTVIELAVFYFLMRLSMHWNFELAAVIALIPTIGARIVSSVFNFTFNFKFVFYGQSKKSIYRYYTLWLFQLFISYGFACVITYLFNMPEWSISLISFMTTLCKGLFDFLLGMISYQIQQRWVFKTPQPRKFRFYGSFLHFCRGTYNKVVRKYNSFVIPNEKTPAVYLCRHLNMRGPIKVCQSLDFDVHMFVLHKFFSFKEAYRQYSTYTFTARHNRRGIRAFFGKVGAFIAALVVPTIVKSAKSIPVYRGSSKSIATYHSAMEYLQKDENIMIFPDIDYTAPKERSSKIYTGFLLLDRLYYRTHKTHLEFIVIAVDDVKKEVYEVGRATFNDSVDFKDDMPRVASEIHAMLMRECQTSSNEE